MVKTPACHAGDEGIVTPAGRQISEVNMKGTLIIDTDQNGKVIAWEQHNMAVFTHVYNQILNLV